MKIERKIKIEVPFLDGGLKIWKAWALKDGRIIILCIPKDQKKPNDKTKLIIGKIGEGKVIEEMFPEIDAIIKDKEGTFISSIEGSLRVSPEGLIVYGSHNGNKFIDPIPVIKIKGNVIEIARSEN